MGKKKEGNKLFIIGLLILVVIFLSKGKGYYSGRFVYQEPSEEPCPHQLACANFAYQMFILCMAAGYSYNTCNEVYDAIYNSCITKCHPPPEFATINEE